MQPAALPDRPIPLGRHLAAIAVTAGACVAIALIVAATGKPVPKRADPSIPVPFFQNEASTNLAGSVTYRSTLPSGIEFYTMDFLDNTTQSAPAERAYLITVPAGVTQIPFEQMVLDSNGGTTRKYYGYIYTSSTAATEIANQGAAAFATRFPGVFFASAAALAAHGPDLNSFAQLNGITFVSAGAGRNDHNNALLKTTLIALIPIDQAMTINIAPKCGNAWLASAEACDDGNIAAGDGCSATCTVETGFTCTGDPSVCTGPPVCGNGLLQAGEVCDDGDTDPGDGCSATCAVETGFTCTTASPSVCTPDPECGDGFTDQGENCDDGNITTADGCNASCDVESGFTCNTNVPNVCTKLCGNGVRAGNEACDDGNDNAGDGCSATCAVETGFTCAAGTPDVCTPICGNGAMDGNEACDDGDNGDGDGCSATCTVETGFTCTGEPSVCSAIVCGNTVVETGETCDDGNTTDGDGCSSTCQTEVQNDCGNNLIDTGEFCDDGNAAAGDGCSDTCFVESGFGCTGEPSQCSLAQCRYTSSGEPTISDDGGFVAFHGFVGQSVELQSFLLDRSDGSIVSITDPGNQTQSGMPAAGYRPVISGNGRYIVLNAAYGPAGGLTKHLMRYDRNTDTYLDLGIPESLFHYVSDDGSLIAYEYESCIIVYDAATDKHRNIAGMNGDCMSGIAQIEGSPTPLVTTDAPPFYPNISGDGRYVFFAAEDPSSPELFGAHLKDIYRVDLQTLTAIHVSESQLGSRLSVSDDGNLLVYSSLNVAGEYDEFRHDFIAGTVQEFDLEGTFVPSTTDTNVDDMSDDGSVYSVFGGSTGGIHHALYDVAQGQLILDSVPNSTWTDLSGNGQVYASIVVNQGAAAGQPSLFIRTVSGPRDLPQSTAYICPN